jgi:hypothetical protein
MVWSHNNHNVLDVNTYVSFNPDFAKQWYENNTYQGFTYLEVNFIGSLEIECIP